MKWNAYCTGVRRGLPVGVGYFSVSFGFGAMAVANGIQAMDATLISLTNLTSAGQFAGLTLILAAAGLWEMVLTMLVINSRYALMSLALSQKMQGIGILPRLAIAFFNTDEIFALAMAEKKPLTVPFLLGLGLTPDAVLTDVEDAMNAMGEVTGAIVREDITNRIFERFCVGK